MGGRSSKQTCSLAKSSSPELKLLVWNIQGLLGDFLYERSEKIIDIINVNKPSVIMFQEVIESTYSHFKKSIGSNYDGFSPYDLRQKCPRYFTAIFIRKSEFQTCTGSVTPFFNSQQGRDMLIVNASYHDYKIKFITSHLESMPANHAERKNQLSDLYQTMISNSDNQTIIYGGDTNLTDEEFDSVVENGNFNLSKVTDVCQLLGSPDSTRYTWDTESNDNIPAHEKGKFRLDRIFLKQGVIEGSKCFKPNSMEFVGTEKSEWGIYCSDHWGLLVRFAT